MKKHRIHVGPMCTLHDSFDDFEELTGRVREVVAMIDAADGSVENLGHRAMRVHDGAYTYFIPEGVL